MKKIIAILLLCLFISSPINADSPSESEQTINATARLNAATVKLTTIDSVGTGFYIAQHTILTNEHVVHSLTINSSVTVTFKDDTSCGGKVAYKDEVSDLAIVATTCARTPLPLTESVQEGQTILALGNPLGFDFTISKGIVSNLDYWRYIQFDARIEQGSSGGVLSNLDGEVVGIVTAVAKKSDYIGMAIGGKRINQFLSEVKRSITIE